MTYRRLGIVEYLWVAAIVLFAAISFFPSLAGWLREFVVGSLSR